jgi:nucleoside-diphosphate-sugar epimerase
MHDWIFMDDVVSACLASIEKEYTSGEIFNIASGVQHSNEEIIELIRQITGGNIHTKLGAHPLRASDTTFCIADIRKAKKQLDWQPQVDLRHGLEKCHLFWQSHESNSIDKLAGN